MKKIGLAVCYDTKNFGSQLQVLATVKKIEELGCETEIIRYKKAITPRFVVQTVPRFFNIPFIKSKFSSFKKKKQLSQVPQIEEKVKIRNERFNGFVKEYFTNLSEPYKGWETLVKETKKNYDAFLCGSDQLWLPMNLGSHFYTLEFADEHKPKIAYATSFGVSQIPWYQKGRTAKYLKRFSALSSRELRGSQIIKELTDIDAVTVCDPTLLFSGDEWLNFIPQKKVCDGKYIFAYFLGENEAHREATEKFAKEKNLPIVTIPFLDHFVERDMKFGDKQMFDVDSTDFVNLIRNAEYICTDSFHGSVFSILNHKKFVTFSRFSDESKMSRNSRIESLFKLTGLEKRHCRGDVSSIIDDEIDYCAVEEKLSKMRSESIEFLNMSLKHF